MCSDVGILGFVHGIDLTHTDTYKWSNERESGGSCIKQMRGLRWISLKNSSLDCVPVQLSCLHNLEHVDLSHNRMHNVYGELTQLTHLRSLLLRDNLLKSTGIPSELFTLEDLDTLDISSNVLKNVPDGLQNARSLLCLNLSNTGLTSIPGHVLASFTNLLLLDISDNNIETVPPQLRRLSHLQSLSLANNPLGACQLRQITSLINLHTLNLSNTQRTCSNMPNSLHGLTSLSDLNLSNNSLERIPECVLTLPSLRRFDVSSNCLHVSLSADFGAFDVFSHLETLNLSRNQLSFVPASLCKLSRLRKLYLNENCLDFNGLPAGLSKLVSLITFSASHNLLEMIPESLCRCGNLRVLILSYNRLVTLPDTIHLISDTLNVLDLDGNPDLVLPPRPNNLDADRVAFYNVDFSLHTQMLKAGASTSDLAVTNTSTSSDPSARKLRLRKAHEIIASYESTDSALTSGRDNNSVKILRGMTSIARERTMSIENESSQHLKDVSQSLKPRRWQEALEKPSLDYSQFFDIDVGHSNGLKVWEIENFVPNEVDEIMFGTFYVADCYIILHTEISLNSEVDWQIYFWIGNESSVDKRACAAIHAVNLRNMLGATARTQREEQDCESEAFKNLFPSSSFAYVQGARTVSGFYINDNNESPIRARMYLVHKRANGDLYMQLIYTCVCMLDSRYVFILDAESELYIWVGKDCVGRSTLRSKAQLLAERINKQERKGTASVNVQEQNHESERFWFLLKTDENLMSDDDRHVYQYLDDNVSLPRTLVFEVRMGAGYLELPQLDLFPGSILISSCLQSTCIYIFDCDTELYVWIGRKSPKLLRVASVRLAYELARLKPTSISKITNCSNTNNSDVLHNNTCENTINHSDAIDHNLENCRAENYSDNQYIGGYNHNHNVKCRPVTVVREGVETVAFKSKFYGWNDVIGVDFTRTAESVRRTGPDLSVWARTQHTQTDLTALFSSRQSIVMLPEALSAIDDCNDELDRSESFVLEGKRFVRLPDHEFGIFYSKDCYVFICHYWVSVDETNGENDNLMTTDCDDYDDIEGNNASTHCVVYFWQGRDASNMGWLTFTFDLQQRFQSKFGNNLEVIRVHQQQEPGKLMAHFKRKYFLLRGSRPSKYDNGQNTIHGEVVLSQLRHNSNPMYIRCIQVDTCASQLCSQFCYILKVPFDSHHVSGSESNRFGADQDTGIVYVWIGHKSSEDEAQLCQEISEHVFPSDRYSIQVINEGEEPENFFWLALGGRKVYDKQADYMQYTRLFRCTNERGYFSISEKCSDFCQDELDEDDIMLLDNGEQVFLWMGPRSSEVEVKMAYKSAQVYVQHARVKQPNQPRKLFVTVKGKESRRFTKCFHGWCSNKQHK